MALVERLEYPDLTQRILAITCYPWASGESNTTTNRNNSAAKRAFESVKLALLLQKYCIQVEGFEDLRKNLSRLLEKYTDSPVLWDGLPFNNPDKEAPPTPVPSQDETFSTRVQAGHKSRAAAIAQGTKNAVAQIVKIVNQEMAGAIAVPDEETTAVDFRASEDVYYAAKSLFEAIAVASFKAQQAFLEPFKDRRIPIPRSRISTLYEGLEVPEAFAPAPPDITNVFYGEVDLEELADICALGAGSLVTQKRVDAAEKAKLAREERAKKPRGKKSNLLEDPALLPISSRIPTTPPAKVQPKEGDEEETASRAKKNQRSSMSTKAKGKARAVQADDTDEDEGGQGSSRSKDPLFSPVRAVRKVHFEEDDDEEEVGETP
ncbi:hypothetical protein CPB83DRAFT_900854 [Crepidotus variabilis]|uniref:Uncharacterized protein n=1 Tax=Crepidotus variabilis TaxID=179855 RepID=A0A9P6BBM0_9AGAR|nr:hypothetical protein CPB83DRAFT_900854 [Crepidotus variabilis]